MYPPIQGTSIFDAYEEIVFSFHRVKTPQYFKVKVVFSPRVFGCLLEVLTSIYDLLTTFSASLTIVSNRSAHFTSPCALEFLGDAQGTGSGTILKMGERTS